MKNRIKQYIKWLPGILISGAALYFLFSIVSLNDLVFAFKKLTAGTIALYIIGQFFALIFRAKGWQALLQKAETIKTFFVVAEGYLFNNLIPRSGEIARAVIMGGISGLGTMRVLSTIVVERVFDLILAAVFFLLTLPLAIQMEWLKPIATTMLIAVFLLLGVLFLAAYNLEKVEKILDVIGTRWSFFKIRIKPAVSSALLGLSALTEPRKWIASLVWIILSWLVWTCMMFVAIRTVSPTAPFWWAIFCQGMLALGIALPSAPAGLGVFEGTLVVALSIFKIPQADALGMALGLHFTEIAMNMVCGVIGLFKQGQSFSHILSQIGNSTK